jgi:hypothetical protein
MSDRYAIAPLGDPFPGGWLQVVDTRKMLAVLAGATEYREQLQIACDQLNARERLAAPGHVIDGGDVIEYTEPAVCHDTFGVRNIAWPFARDDGRGRYRWTFTACGTVVTHHTDAAGLQVYGRVVRRQTAIREQRLVQLVDRDGTVFASVVGLSAEAERVLTMEGTRGLARLQELGTVTGRITPESMREALRAVEQQP